MKNCHIKSAGRYNFHSFKKDTLILTLFICLSFILPVTSTNALGAEVIGPGKSYMLDNLYNPSNKTLTQRYSLSRDILAQTDDSDIYAQTDDTKSLTTIKSGYYGTKDWLLLITIYAWLAGINGETGTGDNVADVDMSFGDIWENFDVGGQGHIEFWWKRWMFFVDSTYIVTKENNSETTVIGSLKSRYESKFFLFDAASGYRVAQIPLSSNIRSNGLKCWPSLNVDIYAGGRIFNVGSKLSLKLDTPIGSAKKNFKDANTWFDFIVGTRLIFYTTENLSLVLKTDIGGFGLGFSSDIDWNFAANVAYEWPWWGIISYVGYRVLYVDYEDGSGDNRFVYKIWQTGPQLGVGVRF